MAFCKNCGEQIDDQAVICPKCGVAQQTNQPAAEDKGGFLWGLLGCCVPLVGLILFLVGKTVSLKLPRQQESVHL